MRFNTDIIEKYLELGFKVFAYVPNGKNSTRNYISSFEEIERLIYPDSLLGLDLEKSGLSCVWLPLKEMVTVFSNDFAEGQNRVIALFNYSVPVHYDNEDSLTSFV